MEIEFRQLDRQIFALILRNGGKIIGKTELPAGPHLEQRVLFAIDKILERNKIGLPSLKRVAFRVKAGTESLSQQVLKTMVKAFNF